MNDENKKLEAVRKSCVAAKAASVIVMILFIAATTMSLAGGLVLMLKSEATDKKIEKQFAGINEDKEISIGKYHIATIGRDGIVVDKKMEVTSSIPTLNAYFAQKSKSLSFVLGAHVLLIAVFMAILTVSATFIMNVFDIIIKEGNPFTEKVKRKLTIAMTVLSAMVFFTAGIGFGALCGIVTWAVYTIMDYGCVLKTQSDETL